MVEQQFPGVRPQELNGDRPDNTQRVKSVDRSDNLSIRSRTNLSPDEDRRTFSLVLDTEDSMFANVLDPIGPGEEQSLIVGETGEEMPYTPDPATNVITTRVSTSFRSPCHLKSYVNGELQSTVWIEAGGFEDIQIAGLAELIEGVDELDGTNTIEWRIINQGDVDLEGSVQIRVQEREVSV